MGIFTEETAVILRKSNIQNPVHRLNFPMLASKFHELFGTGIPAGFVLFHPGNILDFAANSFFIPPRVLLHCLADFPFIFVALILEKQAYILQ